MKDVKENMSIEWDAPSYSPDGQKKPINIGRMILSNIEINKDVSKFFRFASAIPLEPISKI